MLLNYNIIVVITMNIVEMLLKLLLLAYLTTRVPNLTTNPCESHYFVLLRLRGLEGEEEVWREGGEEEKGRVYHTYPFSSRSLTDVGFTALIRDTALADPYRIIIL